MVPRSTLGFEVNFDEPVVQAEQEHGFNSVMPPLKWMTPSLSSLRSVPEDADSDWEDGNEDAIVEQCAHSLKIPLKHVIPSEDQESIGEE